MDGYNLKSFEYDVVMMWYYYQCSPVFEQEVVAKG